MLVCIGFDPEILDIVSERPFNVVSRDFVDRKEVNWCGDDDNLFFLRDYCRFVFGIDHTKRKLELVNKYGLMGAKVISNKSHVSTTSLIGSGSVVQSNTWIGDSARIGDWVRIGVGAQIHHGSQVLDFVTISPGAQILGNVVIGKGAWIGAGAIVLPRVKVGEFSIIGAGSVVTRDVPPNSKSVGVPARQIS
jgi:acetyltransferase EpsM